MELAVVRYEVDQGVGVVTLDRPDRLNSWTGRMEEELRWAMAAADDDPAVRVVVLTGAGRGFCSGADMAAIERLSAPGAAYEPGIDRAAAATPGAGVRPDFDHLCSFLLGMRKPVIAAVNGPAAGMGFVLACFADIRFAAVGAKLTTSFGRLGLPAENGVSWILPRLVGPGHAADLLFSSRVVLAEEAQAMGLVNRVLPPGDLLPFTLDYARRMASEISPTSLLTMKRQLYADLLRGLHESASESELLLDELVSGGDFTEGARAWLGKRPPRFPPLPRRPHG